MTVLPPETDRLLKELCHRIRAAGMRVTSARRAVLRSLLKADTPVSHREVADELVLLGIDPATVYRNLVSLANAGLLSRSELGDHVWRFEIRSGDQATDLQHGVEHPHMICVECGSVICLPVISSEFIASLQDADPEIGVIHEIVVRGSCRRCFEAVSS